MLSPESGRGKCSKVFTTSPAKHLLQVLLANESVPEVGGKSRGLALFLGRCAACTHYLRYAIHTIYTIYTIHTIYTQRLARVPQFPVCHNLSIRLVPVRCCHEAMVQYSIFTVTCLQWCRARARTQHSQYRRLTYNSSREILLHKICVVRTM